MGGRLGENEGENALYKFLWNGSESGGHFRVIGCGWNDEEIYREEFKDAKAVKRCNCGS